MLTITPEQRRLVIAHRHLLHGGATGPDEVAATLIGLHATDPATPFLSVLARSRTTTIADIVDAMYARRSMVRWMAMRRTLFVFPTSEIAGIQAAVSTPLAATLRRQLLSRLRRNGAEPPIEGDLDAWLADVEKQTMAALVDAGSATGAQLSARVPGLTTVILPGSPSEVRQNVTSPLLTIMSANGLIVRGVPTGAWTSRNHLWQPAAAWWPHDFEATSEADAQRALARRYLERYGPATADDVQWWTGWNKTTTTRALSRLPTIDVDLHGRTGLMLGEPDLEIPDSPPHAALLPSLDSTPMGWKEREWFLSIDRREIFDTAGNIGPTLWWNGEIIGSWAVATTGEVRTSIRLDRGTDAKSTIHLAAAELQRRLDGTVVTPSIRTPLEKSLL
ncbi:winged helix DNA-binding domain-containing protein [Actinoplanes palleronii]|uniref:winged helix DNA-binding domain-containing protein n=1 Tax=Actinoplanes palleronii TaxID=113570 RepID=UPI0019410618|nr:winged helix DNA-binding domain-containing protein [Actinoplanes palleronii]